MPVRKNTPTPATYMNAAQAPLKSLAAIAWNFEVGSFAAQIFECIGKMDRLIAAERERLAKPKRPSFLRLVVDNETPM